MSVYSDDFNDSCSSVPESLPEEMNVSSKEEKFPKHEVTQGVVRDNLKELAKDIDSTLKDTIVEKKRRASIRRNKHFQELEEYKSLVQDLQLSIRKIEKEFDVQKQKLRVKISSLEEDLLKQEQHVYKLKHINISLDTEYKSLEARNEQLKQASEEKDHVIKSLRETFNSEQTKNYETLQRVEKRHRDEVMQLHEQISQNQKQYLSEFEEVRRSCMQGTRTQEIKLQESEVLLRSRVKEVEAKEAHLSRLKQQMTEEQNQTRSFGENLLKMKENELKQQIETYQNKLAKVEDMSMNQSNIVMLQSERLKFRIKELENEKEVLLSGKTTYNKEYNKILEELNTLKRALKESNEEKLKIQKQILSLEGEISNITLLRNKDKKELETQKNKLTNALQCNKDLREINASLQQKVVNPVVVGNFSSSEEDHASRLHDREVELRKRMKKLETREHKLKLRENEYKNSRKKFHSILHSLSKHMDTSVVLDNDRDSTFSFLTPAFEQVLLKPK